MRLLAQVTDQSTRDGTKRLSAAAQVGFGPGRPLVLLDLDEPGETWSGKAERAKLLALTSRSYAFGSATRAFGREGAMRAVMLTHSLGSGETVRTEEVMTLDSADVPRHQATRHVRVVFELLRDRPTRATGEFQKVFAEAPLTVLGGERQSFVGRAGALDSMLEAERTKQWLEEQAQLYQATLDPPDDPDRRWQLALRGDAGVLYISLDSATSEMVFTAHPVRR